MTVLPGNRVSSGEPQPVWDRHAVEWRWDAVNRLYHCQDTAYPGPPVTEPGAIPPERQPVFAQPPNEAQMIGMALYPEER